MSTFCYQNNAKYWNIFWDTNPLSLFTDWPSYDIASHRIKFEWLLHYTYRSRPHVLHVTLETRHIERLIITLLALYYSDESAHAYWNVFIAYSIGLLIKEGKEVKKKKKKTKKKTRDRSEGSIEGVSFYDASYFSICFMPCTPCTSQFTYLNSVLILAGLFL